MKSYKKLMITVAISILTVGIGCTDEDVPIDSDANRGDENGIDVVDSETGDQETGTVENDAGRDDAAPETGALDLTGKWGKQVTVSAFSDVSFLGETEVLTTSVLFVDVEQNGEDLSMTSQICDIEIVDLSGLSETLIPDAFLNSLPESTREGSLVDGHLDLPWFVEVRGIEFAAGEDWETEPLPTEADDPRVFDQDGDGNPGVTVYIDAGLVSGEIYVIQRGKDRFASTQVDTDFIAGVVEWEDEQETMGASDSSLLLAEPESRPNLEEGASFFEMVRLEDGTGPSSCDALLANRDQLFE